MSKRLLLCLLWACGTFPALATSPATLVTGRWRGQLTQHPGDGLASTTYYFELDLRVEGTSVSGTSYSSAGLGRKRYAAKFAVEGQLDAQGNLTLAETRLIEFQNTQGKAADYCLKKARLTLQCPNDGERCLLSGEWEGVDSESDDACAPGTIHLEKSQARPAQLEYEKGRATRFMDRRLKPSKTIKVRSYDLTLQILAEKPNGDVISLNCNGNWILQRYALRDTAKRLRVRLAPQESQQFLVVFADKNRAGSPFTTTTLVVNDGVRERRLVLDADLEESALVYLEVDPD
jgi:hypothetical protein